MESNPKLIVLQLKDLILTLILVAAGILFIILLIYIFLPKNNSEESSGKVYTAGSYTSAIVANGVSLEVTCTFDSDRIKSVNISNLDETITTMFPLLVPSLEDISRQVIETQSTSNIYISEDNIYTGTVILTAINSAIEKAKLP